MSQRDLSKETPVRECPECGIRVYADGAISVPIRRYLFVDHCATCERAATERMQEFGREIREAYDAALWDAFQRVDQKRSGNMPGVVEVCQVVERRVAKFAERSPDVVLAAMVSAVGSLAAAIVQSYADKPFERQELQEYAEAITSEVFKVVDASLMQNRVFGFDMPSAITERPIVNQACEPF